MSALLALFEPVIAALLNFLVSVGASLEPEVVDNVKRFIGQGFAIAAAFATMQITGAESKDSIKILIDDLKATGDTILGQLEVASEKIPAEIIAGLTGVVGSLPGMLLKLI